MERWESGWERGESRRECGVSGWECGEWGRNVRNARNVGNQMGMLEMRVEMRGIRVGLQRIGCENRMG